jgi:hypothetical protein
MAVELPEALRLASQLDQELRGKTVLRACHSADSEKQAKMGFFNRLIHGYDQVDLDILWAIL